MSKEEIDSRLRGNKTRRMKDWQGGKNPNELFPKLKTVFLADIFPAL